MSTRRSPGPVRAALICALVLLAAAAAAQARNSNAPRVDASGTGLLYRSGMDGEGIAIAWERNGNYLSVRTGSWGTRFLIVDGRTLEGPAGGLANSGKAFFRK